MFNFISVSGTKIGEIVLDAVTSEEHESELTITESPIESGAQVADHAFLNPKTVTISGVMVDHNHQSVSDLLGNVPYLRGALDFLNKIPLPVNLMNYTAQTLNKVSEIAGQIGAAAEMANQVRALAPWMPEFSLSNLLGNVGDSRVQKCYTDLVNSQKSGEPIEINTGICLYKNMLIQKVAVSQDKSGSATFTITAREIFTVDTAYVKSSGSKSSGAGGKGVVGNSKSGRAVTQSAKKTQAGTTQATPTKRSVLKGWVG